jgi:hypothetical protein
MAKIPFSMSANQGGSFQPWPEGTYNCRITETELGTSKAGNPQLRVRLEVVDGTYAGKQSNVWYSLLPKAAWKIDALLTALGIEKEPTGDVDENGEPITVFDDEWLLHRVVEFDVKHREYNGKTQMDFVNERASDYDVPPEDEPAPAKAAPVKAAPKPAPAPVESAPAGVPATFRRRPRPQVS